MLYNDDFSEFKELLHIKRYADSTINTYLGLLSVFQKTVGQNPFYRLDDIHLLQQVVNTVKQRHYSYQSHKQLIAALSLYLKEIHDRDVNFSSVYPIKRPEPLPQVLSVNEVRKILTGTANLKHRAMLTTIYTLGLRSGELLNLRVKDLRKDRKQVHIKAAEGQKDRVLPFPEKLRNLLADYYREYRPNEYLFNGQNSPQYTASSLRQVFKQALQRASISKKFTLHDLRHAYATHMLENGVDIRIIKELLGHKSIRTTLVYTHVTNHNLQKLPSVLDDL